MSDSAFTPLFTGDIHDDDPFVAGQQLVHTDVPVESESVAAEPGTGPVEVSYRKRVRAQTEFVPFTVTVPALNALNVPARLVGADRKRVTLFIRAIGAATDAVFIAPRLPALSVASPTGAPGTVYGGAVMPLYGGHVADLSKYTGDLWYIGQGAAPVVLVGYAIVEDDQE